MRTLRTTTLLTKHQDGAGLRQRFAVVRERKKKSKMTIEVVHGIRSLSPERADTKHLLQLTWGYWALANQLHSKREVTLGEDATRIGKCVAA
jgi:hypothetical protein